MGKLFAWLFGSKKDAVSTEDYYQLENRVTDNEDDIQDLSMAGDDHDARLEAIEHFIAAELDTEVE